jgi:CRP-like cAMP-binding protein
MAAEADSPDPGYVPTCGSFVAKVGERICAELRGLGSLMNFHRNELLIAMDAASDHVLLIERGLVKVLLSSENGNQVIAGIYGPGELIGEQGVLFEQPRSAAIVTQTSGAATYVSKHDFRGFVSQHPDLLRILYDILHARLRRADHRQINLASQDVMTRVAKQLLAWSGTLGIEYPEGIVIDGMSQKELAQCIGAGETTVDAVLKELRERGLVLTKWRRYVLPSPRRLRAYLNRRDTIDT